MFFFFFSFDNDEVPSFDQMMLPLLVALKDLGGSAKLKDLDHKTIEVMGIPEKIRSILHKGSGKRSEVAYRLAWARTYLKKYGVIKNTKRGMWAFTDDFSRDIESLNPSQIVRYVKQKDAKKQENLGSSLTGIESALAFERLVLSLLDEKAKKQKKPIELFAFDSFYDAYLPKGIDDIKDELFVTIKYAKDRFHLNLDNLEKICFAFGDKIDKGKILLVLSTDISSEDKQRLRSNTKAEIIIWSISDISNMIEPEANYVEYLIDPKKALIVDTITSALTREEQVANNNDYLKKLRSAYHERNVTLFLGAGVSISSGIPLWAGLIKQLLIYMISSETKTEDLSNAKLRELSEIAYNNQDGSPLAQMRYIRSAFSDEEYFRFVHKALYDKELDTNTPLLDAIRKISAPQFSNSGIKNIITYNFDDMLEQNIKDNYDINIVCQESDMQVNNKLNIYHVHGYLPQKQDMVNYSPELIFSEEDYHRVYRDAYCWSNLTQLNSFRDTTCLFVGCSLTDPNLRRLLDVAARNGESPRHYAFLVRKTINEKDNEMLSVFYSIDNSIRDSYFRDLGLNIIWIDDYDEIPDMLLNLVKPNR